MYQDKLDERSLNIFTGAVRASQGRDQNYVSVAHIIAALAERERDLYSTLMSVLKVDPDRVKLQINSWVESSPRHAGEDVRIDQSVKELLRRSLNRAYARGRRLIEISDLFICLFQDERGGFNKILLEAGYDCNDAANKIWIFFQGCEQEWEEVEDSPASRLPFAVGERVRIRSGAFAAFTGEITEVDVGKLTVKVHLQIFDRVDSVEFNFQDIEKLTFVGQ